MGHGTNSQGKTFGQFAGDVMGGFGGALSRMGGQPQPQANPLVDAPTAATNDPVLADYFTRHGVQPTARPQPQRRMR